MPGFGLGPSGWTLFTYLVEAVVFLILIGIVWRGRKNQMAGTTLVLKKFHIDESPTTQLPVDISGRASGVISWILGLLRIEPDVDLRVTDTEILIRTVSLGGVRQFYVPLGSVSSTVCGYQRSIWAFSFAVYFSVTFVLNVLGVVFAADTGNAAGMYMGSAFGSLIFAAVAAIMFFLSKRIAVFVETTGGIYPGLIFKRSVIENVSVDLPEALRAISVVNTRVLSAQTTRKGNERSSTVLSEPGGAVQSPIGGNSARCPRCSAVNPDRMRFCESCGFALPV